MANREEIFKTVYHENPSTENPKNLVPKPMTKVKEGDLTFPEIYDTVKPLHQVVDVDYFIPGCPPPPWLILDAFNAIVEGKLPSKGSVLAPLKAVCDECRFKLSEKKIQVVKRIYELEKIEEKCFLEQGVICMGPATRARCQALEKDPEYFEALSYVNLLNRELAKVYAAHQNLECNTKALHTMYDAATAAPIALT